jgi:hypothetical protein
LAALFGIVLFMTSGMAAERPGELSKSELKALLAKASTPQEHLRLARHFEAKAKQYEAESLEHAEMAKLYRARPTTSETKRPMAPDTAAHCDLVSENLSKAASEARALAQAHSAMAKK